MEEGHSGRSSFLLHIPCSWLGKCAATENYYLNVFRKVMRSNQGKKGDRHPDLAEKNLLQKGFFYVLEIILEIQFSSSFF